MGSLKSPCTKSYRSSIETVALNWLVFEKIVFLHFGVKIQDGGSPPSWVFYGPIMGSLKSPYRPTTSHRSSIDKVALNCLIFEKIAFLHFGIKIKDGGSPPSSILGVP